MKDVENGTSRRDTSNDVWHVMDVETTLQQMETSTKGLSTSKAQELHKQHGENKLTEKRQKTLRELDVDFFGLDLKSIMH
jgi:hypothetical protein